MKIVHQSSMKQQLPRLRPLTSPWMFNIMENTQLQQELFDTYGSPINVHDLPSFVGNIKEYLEILDTYPFKSQIFFARKANKFRNLINAAVNAGIGVDTASYQELKQCLDLKVQADKLISTAAIKNNKLLELAVQEGVLLIIDNQDELQQLLRVAKRLDTPAKIGIRVSGFAYQGKKLYSRFGFDIDTVEHTLHDFFRESGNKTYLQVEGLHFHLDGYSTAQRGHSIHQSLDLAMRLREQGFTVSFIDIGGGILMNYLASKNEWKTFQDTLQQALLDNHRPITYNNDGLGYSTRNGKVEGTLATYPYYNENSKASFLRDILETPDAHSRTVAQRLHALKVELRLEPGRSLLNQVGMTMARVAHRKVDATGTHLVGLEMNMSQMMSSSADFLLDPFVAFQARDGAKPAVEVYFTGAYCLERDILLKRKIALPQLPDIGDTIFFVNTAGYMMHFFETEAHLFQRARNLALPQKKATYGLKDFEGE